MGFRSSYTELEPGTLALRMLGRKPSQLIKDSPKHQKPK